MSAKHTPGPWRVGTPGPNGCHTVGTERGLMTAIVAHSLNEVGQRHRAVADANLIAAAPDLLDVVDALIKSFSSAGIAADLDSNDPAEWLMAKALSAHSKATGEQS